MYLMNYDGVLQRINSIVLATDLLVTRKYIVQSYGAGERCQLVSARRIIYKF